MRNLNDIHNKEIVIITTAEKCAEQRETERMDLALQISVPGHEGNTVNISAGGVYFDVVTSDMNAFSPGTSMPIKINALTSTPGCDERNIKLQGQGVIVRTDTKAFTNPGNRLGVALKFKDILEVVV